MRGIARGSGERPLLFAPCLFWLQLDLQSKFLLHVNQSLGISFGVINGMMGVLSLPKVFEVLEGIGHQSLIETAEISRRKPKRIRSGKVVEIPIHELPVESVVVGYKQDAI